MSSTRRSRRAWRKPSARMGLQHAVITSVDRDDLADGGAFIFAETIRLTRERSPSCRIEVLIPDFQGIEASLRTVLDAGPDVLNHNTETVPRLYRMARSGGRYSRTLELLDCARRYTPAIATKTGIMVGLGEERRRDRRRVRRSEPRRRLHPHDRSVPAADTAARADDALLPSRRVRRAESRLRSAKGFVHVESGPLVRSSYHAHEQADAYDAAMS